MGHPRSMLILVDMTRGQSRISADSSLDLDRPLLEEAVRDLIEGHPRKYLGPRSCIPPIGTQDPQ